MASVFAQCFQTDWSEFLHSLPTICRSWSQIIQDECLVAFHVVHRYFGTIAKPLQHCILGRRVFMIGFKWVRAVAPVTLLCVYSRSETIPCTHEPFCSCPENMYKDIH